MLAVAVERLERRATSVYTDTVFENYSFAVQTFLDQQRVAGLTIVDTQPDGLLRGLPALAVIAVMTVRAHIPRSGRRVKRQRYEAYKYFDPTIHNQSVFCQRSGRVSSIRIARVRYAPRPHGS